jgi:polyhydroxyalkanoate synthesis regulator protein
MIDEALLKSNYLGKDGFIWWLGRVAPPESWDKPELVDYDPYQFKDAWGYRCKVRIIGYHTFNEDLLPDEDLPWAHIMLSPSDGSAQGGTGKTHKLVGGETVFGFFLDGEDAQQPVISGLIYRNAKVENIANNERKSVPYAPFSGNTGRLKQGRTKLRPTKPENQPEPNFYQTVPNISSGILSQPINTKVNFEEQKGGDRLFDEDAVLYTNTKVLNELVIKQENGCGDNVVGQITQAIQDFIAVVNGLESFLGSYIDPVLNVFVDIQNQIRRTVNIITGVIKFIINNFRNVLMKLVGELFSKFIALVLPLPQHTPVAEATKNILNIIFCIFEKLIDSLLKFLTDILTGLIGRSINAPRCASEQVTSSILAKLMDNIENLLNPVMSGLDWLLNGIGSIKGILSKASSIANQIFNFIGCDELKCKTPSEWSLGFGPTRTSADNWNRVLGNMDILRGIDNNVDNSLGFLSLYGYNGPGAVFRDCTEKVRNPKTQDDIPSSGLGAGSKYPKCIPPKIEIFGDGYGAQAIPVVSSDGRGSILSIEIVNPGFGYNTAPSVRIIDKTNSGSGAYAEASIRGGRVTGIYLTRPGSGYCSPDLTLIKPFYLVTANKYTFYEGETVTFTVNTQNIRSGTRLSYFLDGTIDKNDIDGSMQGNILIQNNVATVSIRILQDSVNESVEQLRFNLVDSNGDIVARTIVLVNDRLSPILIPTPSDAVQTPPGSGIPEGTGTFIPVGITTSIIDVIGDVEVGIGSDITARVEDIIIQRPGIGFTSGDSITVGPCVFTPIVSPNGSIVGINSIVCSSEFSSLPELFLNTQTGSGAELFPLLKFVPKFVTTKTVVNQVGIVTVVDCVGSV